MSVQYDVVVNYTSKGDTGATAGALTQKVTKLADAEKEYQKLVKQAGKWQADAVRDIERTNNARENAHTKETRRQDAKDARDKKSHDAQAARDKRSAATEERKAHRALASRTAKDLGAKRRDVESFQTAANAIGGGAAGMFDGVVSAAVWAGGAIATALIAGISYGVLGVNQELESTSIALAGLFQANMGGTWAEATEAAAQNVKQMRADAAALPGEFEDLVGTFQTIASSGYKIGMSTNQVEKLAAKTMAAGVVTGLSPKVAAAQMALMLDGASTSRTTLNNRLPGLAKAKVLNKMDPEARRAAIEESLQKLDPAFKAYENSMIGMISSVKDSLKYMLGDATFPLFEKIKSALKEVVDFFKENETAIHKFTDLVGAKLVDAFQKVRGIVHSLTPIMEKAFGFVSKHLAHGRGPGILGSAAAGAGVAGATSAAGAGAAAGGALGGMLGGALGMALGPGGAALGAAVGTLGGTLMGAVAGFDAYIAVVLTAYGTLSALADRTSVFYNDANAYLNGIMASAQKSFGYLGEIFDRIEPAITHFAEFLGTEFLKNVFMAAAALEFMLSKITPMIKMAAAWLGYVPTEGGKERKRMKDERWPTDGNDKHKPPEPPNHTTHIHNVTISVNSNQDPSRIARLTRQELINIARHPTSTGGRNFSDLTTKP